jgi:hypothetical protein
MRRNKVAFISNATRQIHSHPYIRRCSANRTIYGHPHGIAQSLDVDLRRWNDGTGAKSCTRLHNYGQIYGQPCRDHRRQHEHSDED